MKIDSVKENVNFRRAYHKGKVYNTPLFSMYWRRNNEGRRRLGITVSKKLGSSPVRNRVRRIIRAAAWGCEGILPDKCDIIIVARSALIKMKSTDVEQLLRARFENN